MLLYINQSMVCWAILIAVRHSHMVKEAQAYYDWIIKLNFLFFFHFIFSSDKTDVELGATRYNVLTIIFIHQDLHLHQQFKNNLHDLMKYNKSNS